MVGGSLPFRWAPCKRLTAEMKQRVRGWTGKFFQASRFIF